MAKVKAKPTSCACWNSPLPPFLAQEPLPFKRDNCWLRKQRHPLEKTRWLKQPVDLQQLILLVVWLSSFSAPPLDDCQIDLAVKPWCYSWWWDPPWCVPCVLWWKSLSSGFACWHLVDQCFGGNVWAVPSPMVTFKCCDKREFLVIFWGCDGFTFLDLRWLDFASARAVGNSPQLLVRTDEKHRKRG